MRWYAAHLIMYVKFKNHRQSRYPLWENIVLIKANSEEEEAFAKAEKRGRSEEGDCDGSFLWSGKPATWVFAGVRQLILCQDEEERPTDGTEVTYLELEVGSKKMLSKMMEGKTASVKIIEMRRAAEPEYIPAPSITPIW